MGWGFPALAESKKPLFIKKILARVSSIKLIILVTFHKWETKPLTEIYVYSKNDDSGFRTSTQECCLYPEDLHSGVWPSQEIKKPLQL